MKIFLGYASEREPIAREVYAFLNSLGHDVWFDKVNLLPGDDWDVEREEGQRGADLIIHLWSKELTERRSVAIREVKLTMKLMDDMPLGKQLAIFLRLDGTPIPRQLLHLQYVDHGNPEWKNKISAALLKASGEAALTVEPVLTIEDNRLMSQFFDIIEFTENTELFDVSFQYPKYRDEGPYWDFVNSTISSIILGDYFKHRGEFHEMVPPRTGSFEGGIQETFRQGKLVSVSYGSSFYYGGAYPNHHIRCLNFAGDLMGVVTIKDVLQFNDDAATTILDMCQAQIAKELAESSDNETQWVIEAVLNFRERDIEGIWELISQFNFTVEGLDFSFSAYNGLPHVMGIHSALLPWTQVAPYLSDQFKKYVADPIRP